MFTPISVLRFRVVQEEVRTSTSSATMPYGVPVGIYDGDGASATAVNNGYSPMLVELSTYFRLEVSFHFNVITPRSLSLVV